MKKQTRRSHSKKALMLLMSMTLATTCVVGSTYAKYATSELSTSKARVAKFGVQIKPNGQSFKTSYDDENFVSVLSATEENVIAPGTKGTMEAMEITGNPEVSIKVTFKGKFDIKNWKVIDEKEAETYYCPLKITVGETEIFGMDHADETEFENAVNNAINSSKDYSVKGFNGEIDVPSISWEWAFETEKKGSVGENYDHYDTQLANSGNATVELAVETVIEQID